MTMILVNKEALQEVLSALQQDPQVGKTRREALAASVEQSCMEASGRTSARLAWLLEQLSLRLPGAVDVCSSSPPEVAILDALDARLLCISR